MNIEPPAEDLEELAAAGPVGSTAGARPPGIQHGRREPPDGPHN